MAAREGQGLQIAVIIFAMLTIILAITTFIFYSQAQTAAQEKATAQAAAATAQSDANKMRYRAIAAQYALGMGGITEDMVKVEGNKAGPDPEGAEAIMANFKTDMAALGAQAGEPGAVNYRTLPQFLLASINQKNGSVADANVQTAAMQTTKQAEVDAEKARAKAAGDARDKAVADLKDESDKYAADRAAIQADKDKLAAQVTTISAKAKAENDKLAKDRDGYLAESAMRQNTIANQKTRIDELEKEQADLFENPDGKVTFVNQRQALVWLNVGSADGLLRQTSFAVYDHDEVGVANAEPKARVEVVRIVGEHLSEARILEDQPSNPIVRGDLVHTPTWSPGQRIHFALAGFMDIDGDRVNDYDLVKNVILLNGGVIDAELKADGTRAPGKITVNTRYLVLGEPPTDTSSTAVLAQFTNIQDEADKMGTDKISVQDLLTLMGYKPEERTVEMSGRGGGGEFRQRTPGKKAPAAVRTTPAGEAPAAEETPAPEGADPFATPAADPFGGDAEPMPAPAPADEADPFATP